MSIDLHPQGPVALIVLNRAAARNALSQSMMTEFAGVLARITATPAFRAVVIAAEGPAFCAGHDLKEMTEMRAAPDGGRAGFAALFEQCSRLMTSITRFPLPVIAAVERIATAAGCQLVASCDLAVAGPKARFGTPGVNIGLFCSTPMVALSRKVGRGAAMEMLLTGEMIDAEQARSIGLVNRIAPDPRAAALALAQQIASKSSHTLRVGKRAFYEQAELPLDAAYAYAAQVMTENMLARDAVEGIGAFIEKREPKWQGC